MPAEAAAAAAALPLLSPPPLSPPLLSVPFACRISVTPRFTQRRPAAFWVAARGADAAVEGWAFKEAASKEAIALSNAETAASSLPALAKLSASSPNALVEGVNEEAASVAAAANKQTRSRRQLMTDRLA
jgi:hypothetical protein